jgi:hypothetical protein
MATVKQVYQMMIEGKNAPEILRELKIKPSRLKKILHSKWIIELDRLQRDFVPVACKGVALETALNIPKRLRELSNQDGEPGRKACEALVKYLHENFPPAARMMPKKSLWA